MNRGRTVVMAILAIAGCGICYVLLPPKKFRITRETYEQVRLGLTEAEVKRLIPIADGQKQHPYEFITQRMAQEGFANFGDADIMSKKDGDGSWHYFDRQSGKLMGWARWWDDNHHELVVLFSAEGKVRGKTLYKYVQGTVSIQPAGEWHLYKDPGGEWQIRRDP